MANIVKGEKYYDLDGQLAEIKRQLRQPNGYPFDLEKLKKHLQDAIEGRFNTGYTDIDHLINLDTAPFCPDGWEVVEHKKGGQIKFDPKKIELYLSKNQKNGKVIEGNKLRKELANKPVLNANVLDYLLANPHLIPEEWKGKYVFFWGTIYRSPDGDLGVRCLLWDGGWWVWRWGWLGLGWSGGDPAALLANLFISLPTIVGGVLFLKD